ncbi:hypothetical protein [Bauldia litoralis]|uniref:Uncharacterized protein n=1 Tax=Bauldia litoralis TaxID=665467 RepID=A0A1G6AT36_9HYPH|nr:hypothetical protein [Bauldia litoralis]SDB11576.1 hypothetical protein SAMN02982931_00838 [Bauldia litoralis]
MYRKYALITGFSVGVGLGGTALADDVADAVNSIPGAIEDVRISGSWENDDKSGAYRIVVARTGLEPVTARLFIQWLAYEVDGAAVVEKSVEIKELGELGLDVVDYMTESDVDGLSIFIETINPADGYDETYELHLFSPTEYIFGPATN